MNNKRTIPTRLPKLLGADVELGNFVLGSDRAGGSGYEASHALLREIDGISCDGYYSGGSYAYADGGYGGRWEGYGGDGCYSASSSYGSQDWGRKWLPANGGCVYIDLNHLELALPETISAWDHVAAWRAMVNIARQAQIGANERLDHGQIQALANNSDGQGNSYGGHVNVLLTRRAFENIFNRKLHHLLYLASYQVSSIVFAGAGKVGAENGAPEVDYQISQRADFFEQLTGVQTTSQRPIVNSRDEALCGSGSRRGVEMARLHCIFYDTNLCQFATLLKAGVLQLILAMIEAERTNPNLILDDPVETVKQWSHDPSLSATTRLASGEETTAVDLQLRFIEETRRFHESGGFDGIVPRADEIIGMWEDTLLKLKAGDFQPLAPRLDWVLKYSILQQAMDRQPDLTWTHPSIKYLDLLYSSIDPDDGLFLAYENGGLAEKVVSDDAIAGLTTSPPSNTRAWTRAMLLRKAGRDLLDSVDWDRIRFRHKHKGFWTTYRTLDMPNPLGFTKRHAEKAVRRTDDLHGALDALDTPAGDSQGSVKPGEISTKYGRDDKERPEALAVRQPIHELPTEIS